MNELQKYLSENLKRSDKKRNFKLNFSSYASDNTPEVVTDDESETYGNDVDTVDVGGDTYGNNFSSGKFDDGSYMSDLGNHYFADRPLSLEEFSQFIQFVNDNKISDVNEAVRLFELKRTGNKENDNKTSRNNLGTDAPDLSAPDLINRPLSLEEYSEFIQFVHENGYTDTNEALRIFKLSLAKRNQVGDNKANDDGGAGDDLDDGKQFSKGNSKSKPDPKPPVNDDKNDDADDNLDDGKQFSKGSSEPKLDPKPPVGDDKNDDNEDGDDLDNGQQFSSGNSAPKLDPKPPEVDPVPLDDKEEKYRKYSDPWIDHHRHLIKQTLEGSGVKIGDKILDGSISKFYEQCNTSRKKGLKAIADIIETFKEDEDIAVKELINLYYEIESTRFALSGDKKKSSNNDKGNSLAGDTKSSADSGDPDELLDNGQSFSKGKGVPNGKKSDDEPTSGDDGTFADRFMMGNWLKTLNYKLMRVLEIICHENIASRLKTDKADNDDGGDGDDIGHGDIEGKLKKNGIKEEFDDCKEIIFQTLSDTDATSNITRALRAEIKGAKKDGSVAKNKKVKFKYDGRDYEDEDENKGKNKGDITRDQRKIFIMRMVGNFCSFLDYKMTNKPNSSKMDKAKQEFEKHLGTVDVKNPQTISKASKEIAKNIKPKGDVYELLHEALGDSSKESECKNFLDKAVEWLENEKDKDKTYTQEDLLNMFVKIKDSLGDDNWKKNFPKKGDRIFNFGGNYNLIKFGDGKKPVSDNKANDDKKS